MRGEYKKGYVKITKDQRKKHYSQMTQEELLYLGEKIQLVDINNTTISNHLINKKSVSFNIKNILKTIKRLDITSLIIEYNEKNSDERVLIRDDKSYNVKFTDRKGRFFKAKANLCFVLSLTNNRIITCFWNKKNDNHSTIDWNRYDSNLEIIHTKK